LTGKLEIDASQRVFFPAGFQLRRRTKDFKREKKDTPLSYKGGEREKKKIKKNKKKGDTMRLTPRQKKLLAIGKNKGFLTRKDLMAQYSDTKAMKNAIKRLVILELFKKSELGDKFIYAKEKDETIVRYLMA
jgi:hypothetical protein